MVGMGMVEHVLETRTWEAEAGGSLSLRVACSTQGVSSHPWLHSETPAQTKNNKSQVL